ncbi:DnaJ domain-containing protein [Thermodesulfobacteriota bacterium]
MKNTMPKDYYIVLGVNRGADKDKIKKAYRTIAKQSHPDVVQSLASRKRFLEVSEAYEILSNEAKRKIYDQELSNQDELISIRKAPEDIQKRRFALDKMESLFSSSIDEFFEGFVPGFFDVDQKRSRGKDLFYEAVLSPEEAIRGGLYRIRIPVLERCNRCMKTGNWNDFFCPECNGGGRIRSERSFSLSIPPHVTHGEAVRISLEDIGLNDAYLHVTVLIEHKIW